VVILRDGDDRYAIEVDRLLGEGEFAVRTLDPRFGEIPHVAATSLTEDGLPVLILDPEDLARSIHAMLSGGRRLGHRAAQASTPSHGARVLIVDD
jgi:two-component system, chemotaxis family, sensor histidine kinase and response regulator WspE